LKTPKNRCELGKIFGFGLISGFGLDSNDEKLPSAT